jgi:hypothetical protein
VPSGTILRWRVKQANRKYERPFLADGQKVHKCAFSFDSLFTLYYASFIHQRTPVVPDAPLDDADLFPTNANDMQFAKTQEFVVEFFGTMVLLLSGDGVLAMVVLFGKNIPDVSM